MKIFNVFRIFLISLFALLYKSFQTANKCGAGQYYDTTLLECENCPANMSPSADGK